MGEFQAILDIQYFDMPHPAALLGQLPDPGGGSHAGEPKIFFLETVRQSGPQTWASDQCWPSSI